MNSDEKNSTRSVESYPTVAALILGFFVGVQGIALLPFWVGVSVESFDMSEQAGGYLATVQLGVATLATLLLSVKMDKLDRRKLYIIGGLISITGNLLSIFACYLVSTEMLFVGRFIDGLGGGIIVATVSAVAAGTVRPIRTFAFMNGGMAILAGFIYLFSPYAIELLGALGIYLIMAAFPVGCPLMSFFIPATATQVSDLKQNDPQENAASSTNFDRRSWIGLLSYALYTSATGGVWVYAERVGTTVVHLELDAIGRIIAVAAFLFVVGPYLAAHTSSRFGRNLPIIVSCIVYLCVAMGLAFTTQLWTYTLVVIGHTVVAGYFTTYVPALFAEMDTSGRVAAASPAFNSLGNAFGPAIMAFSMPFFSGYMALGWVSVILLSISGLGLVFMATTVRKSSAPCRCTPSTM